MSAAAETSAAPLAVRGATLKFGGVTALDDVSVTVNDGELLAIIGPNGAGKTSLLNVTAGFYRPQQGHVELSGKDVTGLRVDQIARSGLARTFQGTHLFAGQTVIENIMIGRHTLMNSNVVQAFFHFGPVMREEAEHRKAAEEIIDFLEIEAIRNKPVGTLGYGLRKRVDLGRALAQEPSILMMDEPMAGMNSGCGTTITPCCARSRGSARPGGMSTPRTQKGSKTMCGAARPATSRFCPIPPAPPASRRV